MDFKLSYKIQEVVKGQYKFLHLAFNDSRLNKYDVVFTTKEEYHKLNPTLKIVLLNPSDSTLELKLKIIKAVTEGENDECIIGIDPGLAIGLSIIYHNEVVETNLVYSKVKAIEWIKKIQPSLDCRKKSIRLGKGGGPHMEKLLDLLEKNFPNYNLELVDERSTSIRIKKDLSIHEQAAIQIARKKI